MNQLRIASMLLACILIGGASAPSLAQVARPGATAGPGQPGTVTPGTPAPLPGPSVATPAPATSASPSAAPAQSPVAAPPRATPVPPTLTYDGQILDVRGGYAYFTSGDACKLAPAVRVSQLKTGQPATTSALTAKTYARATVDTKTGQITALAISAGSFPVKPGVSPSCSIAQATKIFPAAELNTGKPGQTGRLVSVTFFVQVPPTTALNDDVYISTDFSGWVPNAIKLDRVDALHYRLTRKFASGTKFAYRYTRGSWTSEERGEDGLEDPPRQFFAIEVDARAVPDIVYHWADETGSTTTIGPNAIPTPFNPNPFAGQGLPAGEPQPSKTTPPGPITEPSRPK